jgi:N-acetylneuraminate synthase/N,N'-diacetyllegionaminate synthase
MKRVRIRDRLVGEAEPFFIIAEAGVNHNGDVNLAKRLVDVAKEAGVDAVKFQTFKAEELVTETAEKAAYQKETTSSEESQFEMIKKLELSGRNFEEISAYAHRKGIIFLSSAFDKGSADLLDKLGVPAFKIGSGEITNFPLLKHIAKKKKPIILSTGMSTLDEVEEALTIIRNQGAKEIILLHCVTNYPAKVEDTNLRAMETLRQTFKLPVGLSDHTLGITIPIAAVALGACVIEKHFTLDKNLAGPDHKASLEPDELKHMVKSIRDVEKAMGDGIKRPTKEEEKNRKAVRKSIVTRIDIPKGAVIIKKMLAIKRPGNGLEAKYMNLVVGKKAKENIKSGETITFSKVM